MFVALDLATTLFHVRDGVHSGASLFLEVAWLLGRDVRRRRRELVLLRERARLERDREEQARTALQRSARGSRASFTTSSRTA